jgi:ribA/ribD-fused uncharacterized protein
MWCIKPPNTKKYSQKYKYQNKINECFNSINHFKLKIYLKKHLKKAFKYIKMSSNVISSGQKNIKAFQDTFGSKTPDKNKGNDNILFYEPKEPYYEFSNFYKTNIEYNGKIYPSSEHLYQAMKFMKDPNNKKSMEYSDIIRQQSTANKAFILAGQKTGGGYKWRLDLNPIIKKYQDVKIRDDWEQNKVKIMKDILMIKFSDTKLKKLLLDTQNKIIIENSPRDDFWGIGKKKEGKNMLGKLLMEVRENLKESEKEDNKPKSPVKSKDPCPKGKIMNPKTKRCVKENGKIGKEIMKQNKGNEEVKKDEDVKPQFKVNKVLNPDTGRYVLKTGKIGKKILENLNNSDNSCVEHLPPDDLPYTNWVCYPNFLVGTYPRNEDVDKIKKLGINIFISLLEDHENLNLYEFRDDIDKYNYPIIDRKITSDTEALKIAKNIFKMLKDKKKVFLHCQGGKGRTGTIAAIVLMLQGKTLKESLKLLKKSIKSRKIQGKCAKMPQTKIQLNQLERIEKNLK